MVKQGKLTAILATWQFWLAQLVGSSALGFAVQQAFGTIWGWVAGILAAITVFIRAIFAKPENRKKATLCVGVVLFFLGAALQIGVWAGSKESQPLTVELSQEDRELFQDGFAGIQKSDPPLRRNKYICKSEIAPIGTFQHALLVEFGVRNSALDGFFGIVSGIDYESKQYWFREPLRTDPPHGIYVASMTSVLESEGHHKYSLAFAQPSVTPNQSFYMYFASNKPMIPDSIIFSDYAAAHNHIRLNETGLDYDKCPRLQSK